MDKQTLSEAISNAKKYAKNLKQQVSISIPQQLSQNSISSQLSFNQLSYLHSTSVPFNKAKSKIESINFFQQKSPPKLTDKSMLNTTSKLTLVKKQVQSESQRENNFQKSQNRMQNKHLSSLFGGPLGSRELINKKNGHNHTYTHLNDQNFDKYSQIQSNMSTKDKKINRLRHSKSPSKEKHGELNHTTYPEQIYKVSSVNYSQLPQRSKSEQKQNSLEVGKLLEEINRLQQIIKKYKCLIFQIKIKYREMQCSLAQKTMNDHFIDALKLQIEQLQDKNSQLNLVIAKQNERINAFEFILVDKITKINQFYSKYVEDRIQLQKQNEILKNMLLIANQSPHVTFAKKSTADEFKQGLKANMALESISKSLQRFTEKWS